jgi:hypothetical protein
MFILITEFKLVYFDVVTAMNLKSFQLLDVVSHNFVDDDRRFGETCSSIIRAEKQMKEPKDIGCKGYAT